MDDLESTWNEGCIRAVKYLNLYILQYYRYYSFELLKTINTFQTWMYTLPDNQKNQSHYFTELYFLNLSAQF